MRKGKHVAALLAVILAGTATLTSCGGSTTPVADNGGSTGDNGSATGYTLNELGQMPLVLDGEASFSIMVPWAMGTNGNNTGPEGNWGVQKYEEMTGVKVEWQVVPMDGWQDKRAVTLAGGKLPDYMGGGSNFDGSAFTDTDLMQYGNQGVFVDLKTLFDENSINLKKILEENPTWNQTISANDGQLYGFPDFNDCFHCNFSMRGWINTTWLKNLGLEMPTTTEEYKQVLTAFKEQDANGNGDPNDEIPLAFCTDGWNTAIDGFLMNAFLYAPSNYTPKYLALDDNQKVYFVGTQDAYKEGLKYLTDLYANGLIAPESFTQDNKTLQQTNENGTDAVIGASFGGVNPCVQGYAVSDKFKEYDAVAPLKGPEGVQLAPFFGLSPTAPGLGVITKSAEDPGLIMRWIDYMYSEEGTVLGDLGQEGVDWRPGEEGEIDFLGNTAKYFQIKDFATRNDDNDCWEQTFPSFRSAEYRESQNVTGNSTNWRDGIGDPELQYYQAAKIYEPYKVDTKYVLPKVAVATDKITDYTLKQTGIEDYMKESVARFVTGDLDVDKDWDSYVQKLNQLGLQEYLQITQEAYDAKYGK